jgi:hypothetical protein
VKFLQKPVAGAVNFRKNASGTVNLRKICHWCGAFKKNLALAR